MATDRMAELGGLGGAAEEGEPPATAAAAAAPRPAQSGAGVVTVEWKWGDAGTALTRGMAHKNPLRWTSGSPTTIANDLRGRAAGERALRPVDVRIKQSGKGHRAFPSAAAAADWVAQLGVAAPEPEPDPLRTTGFDAGSVMFGEPEPEPEPQPQRQAALEEFVQIKATLTRMEDNIAALHDAHRQLVSSTFDAADIRERIERLNTETSALATGANRRLKEIDVELKEALQREPQVGGTTAHKMRRNMQVTATIKLVAILGKHQDQQTAFKQKEQETARRQLKLVKPDATEEELQRVAEGEGGQIFAQMLSAPGQQRSAAALQDVQDKHAAIVEIEKSINELHGLIVDLATLTETQGEMLDEIEHHIHAAKEYIEVGVEELQVANQYAASSRKR